MKSRICFYFAAVVALVLFVAALSSHATERRDHLIVPEPQQAHGAKTAHPTHAKAAHKNSAARNAQKLKSSSVTSEKTSPQSVNSSFEAKDQFAPDS